MQLQGHQDVPRHTREAAAQGQPGSCIIPDYGEHRRADGPQPIYQGQLAGWLPGKEAARDPAQGWPSAAGPLR